MAFINIQYLFMQNKIFKKSNNRWELSQPDKGYIHKPTGHHSIYTNMLDISSLRSEINQVLTYIQDKKTNSQKKRSDLWLLETEGGRSEKWEKVSRRCSPPVRRYVSAREVMHNGLTTANTAAQYTGKLLTV